MKKTGKIITAFVMTALALCGCSTANRNQAVVIPTLALAEGLVGNDHNAGGEKTVVQAEQEQMQKFLNLLTAEAIRDYFSGMGYETTSQKFLQKGVVQDQLEIEGTNIIAVKKAVVNSDQADILIISAHHDTKQGIQGANDGASGVAVMIEAARLIAALDTDTEIRFISFAGGEEGQIGSLYYVEQMTDLERGRVIGHLQLGEMGDKNSDYMVLGTVDGQPTLIGNLLSKKAEQTRNVGRTIPYVMDSLGDHNSFASHGMAAVMLRQDEFAYENNTTQDKMDILDIRKLTQTAQLVADVAADIMDQETNPTYPVPVTEEEPARSPSENEGNASIQLEGNPTTGYEWTYEMEPEGVVEAVSENFYGETTEKKLVGAGGTYVFEFAGKKAGTTTLTFTYARSWEAPNPDSKKKEYELTVDSTGNVTVVETK